MFPRTGLRGGLARSGKRLGLALFFVLLPGTAAALPQGDALDLLQDNTDGVVGVYLVEVNGPALTMFNESFVFEPASTIKATHHVHAMLEVQAGNVDLTTMIPWFEDADIVDDPTTPNVDERKDGCPVDTSPASDELQVGLREMMKRSDNRWTQAMRVFFGEANINATSQVVLGMTDTLTQQRLGCGADVLANPNQLTLVDIGILYEAVATGLLDPLNRASFYDLMLNESDSFYIDDVIDAEASALGLTAAEISIFKLNIEMAHKGGSNTLIPADNIPREYRSLAGWILLPFECEDEEREYVYGTFVHEALSLDTQNTGIDLGIFTVGDELLRPIVRDALESVLCDRAPDVTAPPPLVLECNTEGGVAGDDPQVLAWLAQATATDECDVVTVTNTGVPALLPAGCPPDGEETLVVFQSTDSCGSTGFDGSTITVEDTTPPTVASNAPATIKPPDAPISFTATAADVCCPDVVVEVVDFACFFVNGSGKVIDKGESCEVVLDGPTITIEDSGGVGTHITWHVAATDCCGNTRVEEFEVVVVNPGKKKK